eukprot:GHVQ01025205.1.p1 GENE.GHVQ01025205.1~~GHVQ01025205.1.p1  ORF type:complete len:370 (-),score=72.00 GHVQ01025205.1:181-1290(-)
MSVKVKFVPSLILLGLFIIVTAAVSSAQKSSADEPQSAVPPQPTDDDDDDQSDIAIANGYRFEPVDEQLWNSGLSPRWHVLVTIVEASSKQRGKKIKEPSVKEAAIYNAFQSTDLSAMSHEELLTLRNCLSIRCNVANSRPLLVAYDMLLRQQSAMVHTDFVAGMSDSLARQAPAAGMLRSVAAIFETTTEQFGQLLVGAENMSPELKLFLEVFHQGMVDADILESVDTALRPATKFSLGEVDAELVQHGFPPRWHMIATVVEASKRQLGSEMMQQPAEWNRLYKAFLSQPNIVSSMSHDDLVSLRKSLIIRCTLANSPHLISAYEELLSNQPSIVHYDFLLPLIEGLATKTAAVSLIHSVKVMLGLFD